MKLKILFVFIGVIMLQKSVSAQQTMLPDISPAYLDKLISIAKTNYPAVRANQSKVEEAQANVTKANISYLDAGYHVLHNLGTVCEGKRSMDRKERLGRLLLLSG